MRLRKLSFLFVALLFTTGCNAIEGIPATPPPTLIDRVAPIIIPEGTFQPPSGDWLITEEEIIENSEILLDGNLTITDGGNLTVRNVQLIFNAMTDGKYGIRVQSGGRLTIERGSLISAAEGSGRFFFIVEAGSQFVMRDSELHDCGWGTEWQGPGDPVEPVPISWDIAGLYIQADDALLERNVFSHNFGALILDGRKITVAENTIENNIYSPITILGSENVLRENDIYHVPVSGFSRCIDVWGHGNSITGNNCSTQREPDIRVGGIYLLNSWDNLITDNTFEVTTIGIAMSLAMDASSNNIITNNVISTWETGITLHGRNNLVEGNIVQDTGTGIEVMYAYDSVIANNTLSQIGISNGIRMTHASGNSVINNRITTVDSDGIFVWNRSQDNLIQGNIISDTFRGLAVFYESDNNVIRDNVISDASSNVIYVDDASGNTIYRNNFYITGLPPFDDGNNQWDFDNGGNYWDNYIGSDVDRDGIGETAYEIQGFGVDRFPLMTPVTPEDGVANPPLKAQYQEPLEQIEINTPQVWENQTLTLETQITINAGGSLTLRNVSMTLGSEAHDAYIWVNPGGALYIYDGHFAETERGYGSRITLMEGTKFVMENSDLRGIRYDWWNGGFEILSDEVIITGNQLIGVMLKIQETGTARITDNTIRYAIVAISVENAGHVNIANNTIDGSIWAGISLEAPDSQDNLIADNLFKDVWSAISINAGTAIVSSNQIVNSTQSGISINTDGNVVVDNEIADSGNGISLWQASSNQVMRNTVANGWSGVEIYHSSGNTISGNTFTGSGRGGYLDEGSQDNLLVGNNFVNNVEQAWDYGMDNRWDDNSKGNYWSDYTGADKNADGIGDTFYVIDANGIDRFPLTARQ